MSTLRASKSASADFRPAVAKPAVLDAVHIVEVQGVDFWMLTRPTTPQIEVVQIWEGR